jgi:hypothetical protein
MTTAGRKARFLFVSGCQRKSRASPAFRCDRECDQLRSARAPRLPVPAAPEPVLLEPIVLPEPVDEPLPLVPDEALPPVEPELPEPELPEPDAPMLLPLEPEPDEPDEPEPEAPMLEELPVLPPEPLPAWVCVDDLLGSPPGPGLAVALLPVPVEDEPLLWATAVPARAMAAVPARRTLRSLEAVIALTPNFDLRWGFVRRLLPAVSKRRDVPERQRQP